MRLMTGWKDNVVFSFVYYQSRAQYISYESGKEQCSFRTRTGSNIIYRYYVKVKEQGGKEQCFFRTHTGTNKISYVTANGVSKNRVLLAHVPETRYT
jgi:hypothetical protein